MLCSRELLVGFNKEKPFTKRVPVPYKKTRMHTPTRGSVNRLDCRPTPKGNKTHDKHHTLPLDDEFAYMPQRLTKANVAPKALCVFSVALCYRLCNLECWHVLVGLIQADALRVPVNVWAATVAPCFKPPAARSAAPRFGRPRLLARRSPFAWRGRAWTGSRAPRPSCRRGLDVCV